LVGDWSRVVTEGGKQLQTVGHHFKGSRPLNNTERGWLSRDGLCIGCHQEIPRESLAVSILQHIATVTGQLPGSPEKHAHLLHKVLLTAGWAQVLALIFIPVIAIILLLVWRRKGERPFGNHNHQKRAGRRLTTACSGRRYAPPLVLSVSKAEGSAGMNTSKEKRC